MSTPKHHLLVDNMAKLAQAEISMLAKKATERMNRKIGQAHRYIQAQIELARRESGCPAAK